MHVIAAFLLSVILVYLVATVLISQFNIAAIVELGQPVALLDRLACTGHDLLGMLTLYLPLIAVALLIAFLFTRFLLQRFFTPTTALYMLAGFTALLGMHLLMMAVFGLAPLAPTRSLAGLLSQGFAGMLGGWLFYSYLYQSRGN